MTRLHFGLLVAATFLSPGVASADVVGPDPTSCPNGGIPSSCHGGPHCRMIECASDADCAGGATCRPVSACIGSVNCAGLLPPDADIRDYATPTVEGTCETAAECASGDECRTVSMCVMAGVTPGSSGGCGCDVARPKTGLPSESVPLALSLVALGIAVAARRRG